MITFGYLYKEGEKWAVDITSNYGQHSHALYAEKRETIVKELKARGYTFNGITHDGPVYKTFKVLWHDYPRLACIIAQTDYGIQIIGETNSDTLTIYDNGAWACEYPEIWPNYIKAAAAKVAAKICQNK